MLIEDKVKNRVFQLAKQVSPLPIVKIDLTEKQALAYFEQILVLLMDLHNFDIALRSISEQNIFSDCNGNLRILSKRNLYCRENQNNGFIPMRPACYNPPEALAPGNVYQNFSSSLTDAQMQTNLIFFKAGDVWSLGIFLYKMLHPKQNLSEPYDEILVDTKYSGELCNMLQWMLQKDAGLRPTVFQLGWCNWVINNKGRPIYRFKCEFLVSNSFSGSKDPSSRAFSECGMHVCSRQAARKTTQGSGISKLESTDSTAVLPMPRHGSMISKVESTESLLIDTHKGNAWGSGLDLPRLNLNLYSPAKDKRPVNQRNRIALRGPSPVSMLDARRNTCQNLRSRRLTSLFVQEKNLPIRVSLSKDQSQIYEGSSELLKRDTGKLPLFVGLGTKREEEKCDAEAQVGVGPGDAQGVSFKGRQNYSTFDNINHKNAIDNKNLVNDFESRKKEDLDPKHCNLSWFGGLIRLLGCGPKD